MRSAKSIMLKRKITVSLKTLTALVSLFSASFVFAQDNSPYSRYGLGDVVPNTNIVNRGMGGISAAYADFLSINFNNPASYSGFVVQSQANTSKIGSGRVLFDVGVNIENRTLRSPNQVEKFTASNALFSYLQVGVPLRKNWGLSFGIKPVTRISYKIQQGEKTSIDSILTQNTGDGGAYLPSIGTGVRIKNFSVGVNVGYLFGKRETTRKIGFANDSVDFKNGDFTTNTSFGDLFFYAGLQYNIKVTNKTNLRLGVTGNLKQSLNATQDYKAQTFVRSSDGSDVQLDSVYENNGVKGEVIYPGSTTFGFMIENGTDPTQKSWALGADFVLNQWDDYRFFGAQDAVKNNWQVRAGGQFRPKFNTNFLNRIAYRAGLSFGPDYVTAGGDLPAWSATLGFGVPVANYNRISPNQYTIVNLALEYNKRGNDENPLKENLFRLSVGLNFSDLWFTKRKYD